MEKQTVEFRDLGHMDYKSAWEYQEQLMNENLLVKKSAYSDGYTTVDAHSLPTKHFLLFVEHPPVYTLGKSGKSQHLLIAESERQQKGIEFFHTNRGGDITFHGPEQIVGYPIFDLEKFYTDIGKYLRNLEEVIIHTLQHYGIAAGRSVGETGVWIDATIKGRERKICAMGVRCSRWITMHGFALNVNTDLNYFNYIVPCGIQNKKVTSMKEELGTDLDMTEVKEVLKRSFEEIFGIEIADQKSLVR